MLNPFPIQFLAPIAYFVLRVALGFLCMRIGLRMLHETEASKKRKALGSIFLGAGALLVIGLYTQIAALPILSVSLLGFFRRNTIRIVTRTTLALMAVMAFSLFITGAGILAFDLPL